MINNKKVVIIGGQGTGKTTLGKNLSKVLGIDILHIDSIHHLPGWKVENKEKRDGMIHNWINKEKWITDGTYTSTLEKRIEESDLVIFLNFNKVARLSGITKRCIKNLGKERPEIQGCKERLDIYFIKRTILWDKEKETQILELLNKFKDKDIITFKNRKTLNKWYVKQFGIKIDKKI